MSKRKWCPDCEPVQVNHFIMRAGAYLELVLKPILHSLEIFFRRALHARAFSLFDTAGPFVLRTFAALRLGVLVGEVSEKDSDRTRCLFEEAKRRGIDLKQFRAGAIKDIFIARFQGSVRCFDGLPRPVGPEASSLYWMDNKPKMRERFADAGIPIARGASAFTKKEALRIFQSLMKPVIVKPYSGSRSRHTTIHIETEAQLRKAFRRAKVLSPLALIEEELEGTVHRGTLIGGRLVAMMRREPPHVVGDGVQSVRALVEEENKNPKRHGRTFHPIATGLEAEAELARQNLSFESVPKKGQFVTLHPKISRGIGASTTDLTRETHPKNKALLERIGALLADPLVGVDFIMNDVSLPFDEQNNSGVIECNSLPFIDLHHYPLKGEPRNVAGALWDIIFPESRLPES